jgi:prolyl oligopeptidase
VTVDNCFRTLAAGLVAFAASFAPLAQVGTDDLAWLEEPRGESALTWARAHTRATQELLEARPAYAEISADLRHLLSVEAPLPGVAILGDKFVRLLRDSGHPHGVLQVASRGDADSHVTWRDALDVDALRRAEGIPYELQWDRPADSCLPPAYDRCILRLSPGGGDAVELREFDLTTRSFVTDGFFLPASLAQAVWLDANQLLVTHTLGDAPRTAGGLGAAVHRWRRGEAIASAPVVFHARAGDVVLMLSGVGSGAHRQGVATRAINYSTFELVLIDASGGVTPVDLPRTLRLPAALAATERHLIVQLTAPARIGGHAMAAETLLSYDVTPGHPASRRVQVVHEPRADEHLSDPFLDLVATRSRVHFVTSQSLRGRLITAAPGADGWTGEVRAGVEAGTSLHFTGADPLGEDFVVQTTGFLQPGRLDLWRRNRAPLRIGEESAAFDASRHTVEIRSAVSRDGTSVPYYLVRPAVVQRGVAVPTLMTGYGAFGVPLSPAYLDDFQGGRSLALWLGRGGALVIPVIRGGGELGVAWHQAGMRAKRQSSYDDFIAVAQLLTDEGFTRRDRLGVFGASNGGLLAAVVGTQRPDLFGAVVSDVPLTDMLRFPEMGMGALWIDEYGDPRDPAMAKVLRAYSPLHRVEAGVDYPPFLITTSTEDNRVGPGHARKLAAQLLKAGAIVHFLEDGEGGHGVSDSLSRPDFMVLRLTFLIDRLMPSEAATRTALSGES